MSKDVLNKVLRQIDELHTLARELRESETIPHGEDSPDGSPPPEIQAVLNSIGQNLTDPGAQQQGYTVVFALIHNHNERQDSMVSTTSEADIEKILVPEDTLVSFSTAFSNPQRLRVLRALAPRPLTSAELAEATGLQGGQLYHHLRELIHAGLVTQESRNLYLLTRNAGVPAYLGMCLLAKTISHGAIAGKMS